MTDPDCVFCAIVAGTSPAAVVAQDETCVAFLDTTPLFPGHVLVVPRDHLVTLPDLPAPVRDAVFALAQRVAAVLPGALDAQGTFVAMNNVVSQSVPHLHVHVVPRRRRDGLRGFFWPRRPYAGDAEREEFRSRIAAALL